MKIELDYLTRIEGHAHLVIDRNKGEICECRLEIVETPRFFEAMLQGRHYNDVAPIVSRVCGVCSISHTLASLMATENALGIDVPMPARQLRRLLSFGEIIQSHLLQLYFMAVPDYLGVASLFQVLDEQQELIARALRLKRVGNRISEVIGGRPVHPVTTCVGGFSTRPEASEMKLLRQELVAILPDLEATVELFDGFCYPQFTRQRNALCLHPTSSYPLHDQQICSSSDLNFPVADYKQHIVEYLQPNSTAKLARTVHGSYMVGSQARLRNAAERLSPMASKVARALALDTNSDNPFLNLQARLVEVVHFVEEAIHTIDALLLNGFNDICAKTLPTTAGQGMAAVEAPRGTLFHSYRYSAEGILENADCIIPTAQNLASIEADLETYLPKLLDLPDAQLKQQLEILIRSYDPCLSCSTHLLRIDLTG